MVILLFYLVVRSPSPGLRRQCKRARAQIRHRTLNPKLLSSKPDSRRSTLEWKKVLAGARSACPPSWLHLEGSMFNVSFSEQHHTLGKESDAQRRNFERSSAEKCTTVLVQCSDLAQNFEM